MVTVALPDTWVYALRLPHDPRAARVARMTVRAALHGHGMREVLDTVELLTSELVTNAYLHGKGPSSLRLTALGDGRLRVGLWDGCPRIPPPFDRPTGERVPLVPPDSETGRGLYLVQRTPTPGAAGRSVGTCWGGVPESCCGSRWGDVRWSTLCSRTVTVIRWPDSIRANGILASRRRSRARPSQARTPARERNVPSR
ncbi:ATP-binding protein [Streptomyces griseoaurantiacus]|uniref:ATP-binding protein n=1 Tax=Streptomyces griseoaurantiacus TaxID=68213 RepID=UPI0037F59A02